MKTKLRTLFITHIPFHKILGIRLGNWSFLAMVDIPEQVDINDSDHMEILIGRGKYFWNKARFGMKIIPIRPSSYGGKDS